MTKTATIGVDLRPVAELVPYERNARKHPASQVRQIANLIREFGWTNPILADEGGIVAGHGRQLAANLIYGEGGQIFMAPGEASGGQQLPPGMVPVVDCTGWDERQRRAYILADNASALSSEWDDDLLKLELSWLEGAEFDLSLTGFDGDALAAALGGHGAGAGGNAEPDPLKVSLADRFGVPPFSVLRAAEGWWQDRKRAWLALGIMSELGRGEGSNNAAPGGSPRPLDRMKARTFGQDMLDGDGIVPNKGVRRSTEAGRKANATPGGSAMPAASYGKTKARGDGRGRPLETEDLRGGLTHRTTTDPYRDKARKGKTDGKET